MEVKFKLTIEDYNAISSILGSMGNRRKIGDIVAYSCGAIVIICLIILSLAYNNIKWAVMSSLSVLIMLCIYTLISKEPTQQKVVNRMNVRASEKKKNHKYFCEQQINLKKDIITHTILNNKIEIKINSHSKIITKENYILFYSDTTKRHLYFDMAPKTPCIIIPRSAFNTLSEEENFIKNITFNIER